MEMIYDIVNFFLWDAATEDTIDASFEEKGLIPVVMFQVMEEFILLLVS